MASELQRRKVSGVFDAMDVDGDGFLEQADFEALTSRWTSVRDLEPGDPAHTQLTEIMMGWWQALLAASDRDRDDKVTLDEVLDVVDQLPNMLAAVRETANAMFTAIDENNDDRISASEYKQLIDKWNGRPVDTDAVFPRLDLDGDGYLSRAEFTTFWTEFWVGDDPAAAGNWVFGEFDLNQPA